MMDSKLEVLTKRLEAATMNLESIVARLGTTCRKEHPNDNLELVEAFDNEFLNKKIQSYFNLSQRIGGDVAEQSRLVKASLEAVRELLVTAAKYRAPKPNVFRQVVKELGGSVDAVIDFAEKKRASKYMNHLFTVKEGIGFVGWVTVSPKPALYIKENFDQALFYGNRVVKEYKGKEDIHVEWMQAYTGAIKELQDYVRTYHTTGLVWNPDGVELMQVSSAPNTVAAVPPVPAIATTMEPRGGMPGGLSSAINKGGAITRGLKKVTDDMKTHKNPELRQSSLVKTLERKPKVASSAPRFGSFTVAKKCPTVELQNNKWIIEHCEDNQQLKVTPNNPKEFVYVYMCTKCTLTIHGKLNGITLDGCKRVAVVFDDVISSLEIINSQGIQVQILGKCPTVSVDKTDGCQVYLSKASILAEFVTAKSSEINVLIPDDKGEFTEHAIPEQYKTCWDGTRLVTECTDINV